jgi:predicted esterase
MIKRHQNTLVPLALAIVPLLLAACGGGSDGGSTTDPEGSETQTFIDAGDGSGTTATGFPNVADFTQRGPFETMTSNRGPRCQIFRPKTLGEDGLDHPVIVWGNGTGATPSVYHELLSHWASHGFVVAAAQARRAGTGRELLACRDFLAEKDSQASGVFAGNLDLSRVAASGHSRGAGGALKAGATGKINVTAPFQPPKKDFETRRNQEGPMFLISGSLDMITKPETQQRPIFRAANAPIFWGILEDANHQEPTADAGRFRGPATAWLRFQLMDDTSAKSGFVGENCDLCTSDQWQVQTKKLN